MYGGLPPNLIENRNLYSLYFRFSLFKIQWLDYVLNYPYFIKIIIRFFKYAYIRLIDKKYIIWYIQYIRKTTLGKE